MTRNNKKLGNIFAIHFIYRKTDKQIDSISKFVVGITNILFMKARLGNHFTIALTTYVCLFNRLLKQVYFSNFSMCLLLWMSKGQVKDKNERATSKLSYNLIDRPLNSTCPEAYLHNGHMNFRKTIQNENNTEHP